MSVRAERMKRIGLVTALSLLVTTAVAGDIAYVSNQAGGISRIDPSSMTVLDGIDMADSAPRGLALTPDGNFLLSANQKSGDVAVIDTRSLKIVRRIPIGKNPEFMRMLPDGNKAFVTYEPGSSGEPPGAKSGNGGHDDDDKTPAHVAVIDLHTWTVVTSIVAAPETEGIEFSLDNKQLIVSNEGDDTLTVYAIADGKLLKTVELGKLGHRPRGIKRSPDGKRYVVTLENSNALLVLDTDFQVVKSVPTGTGPYGVAFDKAGKRIVVAASRGGRLQVFDADTYAPLADIPIGKRCWHFTFTPDESNILVACGTSNDVETIDANSYQPGKTIAGFNRPWGIVTYPKANGSLETKSNH
jgi:YVTN family beta-propeller protein